MNYKTLEAYSGMYLTIWLENGQKRTGYLSVDTEVTSLFEDAENQDDLVCYTPNEKIVMLDSWKNA